MAGIENKIIYGQGFKLQPSDSDDIARMQNTDTASFVNFNATPEAAVSANIGSLCIDRIAGNLYIKQTGTGNTGWNLLGSGGSITITGDVSSITGSNLTVFANLAANNSGSTVSFSNSGTVSTFNLSDVFGNTILGNLSGSLNNPIGQSATNAVVGINNLTSDPDLLGGGISNNFILGVYNLISLNNTLGQAMGNIAIGQQIAAGLVSGYNNQFYGFQCGSAYLAGENGNIILGNCIGTVSESNVMRLGSDGTTAYPATSETYISGVVGVATSNSQMVTIDSTTGQLGVSTLPPTNGLQLIRTVNVDMLVGGATLLFTPTTDFIVTAIIAIGIDVTGTIGVPQCSYGSNPTTYDDLVAITGAFSQATNRYTEISAAIGFSAFDHPILIGTNGFFINVVTPDATATTNTQRIDIIGYYL